MSKINLAGVVAIADVAVPLFLGQPHAEEAVLHARDATKGSPKKSILADPLAAFLKLGFEELHSSQAYLPGLVHRPVSGQA